MIYFGLFKAVSLHCEFFQPARAMSMQPSMFSLLLVMTEYSANDQVNESFK